MFFQPSGGFTYLLVNWLMGFDTLQELHQNTTPLNWIIQVEQSNNLTVGTAFEYLEILQFIPRFNATDMYFFASCQEFVWIELVVDRKSAVTRLCPSFIGPLYQVIGVFLVHCDVCHGEVRAMPLIFAEIE